MRKCWRTNEALKERQTPLDLKRSTMIAWLSIQRPIAYIGLSVRCLLVVGIFSFECFAADQTGPGSKLVFIPGLFGSEISKCKCGTDDCQPIWASKIADFTLTVDHEACYSFAILYEIRKLAGNAIVPVYSDASSLLKKRFAGSYFEFAYDWRRSISSNVASFQEYLCKNADMHSRTNYYIVAHSMGGLILKQWLRNNASTECPEERQFSIKEVVFVGTPHLGAPEIIDNVVNGYTAIPYKWIGRRIKEVGLDEHSSLITQYALQIEGTFQFLPVLSSDFCRERAIRDAAAIFQELPAPVISVNGKNDHWRYGQHWDVFYYQTWRSLNFFRFYENSGLFFPDEGALQAILGAVKVERCEASMGRLPRSVSYPATAKTPSPEQEIRYTFIAGIGDEDTTWSAVFLNDPARTLLNPITGAGDGRVPVDSGAGFGQSLYRHAKFVLGRLSSHLGLLESQQLVDTLDRWGGDPGFYVVPVAGPQNDRKGDNPLFHRVSGKLTEDELMGAGLNFQDVPPDPRRWQDPGTVRAVRANAEELAKAGLSPQGYAAVLSSLVESARSFRLVAKLLTAASMLPQDSYEQIWHIFIAAKLANDIREFDTSEVLLSYVIERAKNAANRMRKDGSKVPKNWESLSLEAGDMLRSQPGKNVVTGSRETLEELRRIIGRLKSSPTSSEELDKGKGRRSVIMPLVGKSDWQKVCDDWGATEGTSKGDKHKKKDSFCVVGAEGQFITAGGPQGIALTFNKKPKDEGYQMAAWVTLGTVQLNNVVAKLPPGDTAMGAVDRFEMPYAFCDGSVCIAKAALTQAQFESILSKRAISLELIGNSEGNAQPAPVSTAISLVGIREALLSEQRTLPIFINLASQLARALSLNEMGGKSSIGLGKSVWDLDPELGWSGTLPTYGYSGVGLRSDQPAIVTTGMRIRF